MIDCDIDKCASNSHYCDADATCNDAIGNFTCQCKNGFTGNGTHCDGMDFVRYILIQFPESLNDVLKRDYLIDFLTSLQKRFDQKPFFQIFFCIYI